MAKNVVVQVLGGSKQVLDGASTVAEVKRQLQVEKYSASVNGEPANDSQQLEDGDFVSLSQAVKGGLI